MKTEKISNFIAKNIVTLEEGQEIGYVLNCCFDSSLTKLLGFVVADEESERENYLPIQNVKTIGRDFIIIESSNKIELNYSGYSNSPTGKFVVDEEGNDLGRVIDGVVENNKLTKLITTKCEINARSIYSSGVDCLFFGINKKRKKKDKEKSSFIIKNNLPKIEMQSFEISKNKILNNEVKNNSVKVVVNPTRVMLAPPSLLNKTACCDIYGLNNELIIKKGQIINEQKIAKAKKHGKINLLIINSK